MSSKHDYYVQGVEDTKKAMQKLAQSMYDSYPDRDKMLAAPVVEYINGSLDHIQMHPDGYTKIVINDDNGGFQSLE